MTVVMVMMTVRMRMMKMVFMRIATLLINTVMHSIKKCKTRLGNGLMSAASLKKTLGSRTLKMINRSKTRGNNF